MPNSSAPRPLKHFFTALQFFTRLPIPAGIGFEPEWLRHAAGYFPLTGLVVALLQCALYWVASRLLPAPVPIVMALIAGVYLTGALQEDGFADVCDGFGGGTTRERILEIMKDSRVGAYGVTGIVLLLTFKCLLLAEMPSSLVISALLLAHPLSRCCAATLIWRLDYARIGESKAKAVAQELSSADYGIALGTTLTVAGLLGASGALPWGAIGIGMLCACGIACWLTRKFVRRIGGYTGDCLGAIQQVSEVAVYIGLLAFAHLSGVH